MEFFSAVKKNEIKTKKNEIIRIAGKWMEVR